MNWTISKKVLLENLKKILEDSGKSQTDFNIDLFGEDENRKPRNNLWRSDQNELSLSVVLRVAEILNRSVDDLVSNYPPGSPKGVQGYKIGEKHEGYHASEIDKAVIEIKKYIKNPKRAVKLAQALAFIRDNNPEYMTELIRLILGEYGRLKIEPEKKIKDGNQY